MREFRATPFIITILILLLIDWYTWQAIRTVISNEKFRNVAKYIFIGITVLSMAGIFSMLFFPQLSVNKSFRNIMFPAIALVYISKIFVIAFLFIDDILRVFRWAFSKIFPSSNADSKANPEGITRLKFLSQLGLLAGGSFLVLLTRGMISGGYSYQVRKISLKLKNLPEAFKGLRIVQISDIHSGSWMNEHKVQHGIDMILEQKADIIFFTGDLVNDKSTEVDPWVDHLSAIKAPMGVYSVLGNHDYGDYVAWPSVEAKAANLENLYKKHSDLGWKLMRNEHMILEKDGAKIGLIGVQNWGKGARWPKYGDIDKAMENMPEVPVKILLSHDPSHWEAKVLPNHKDIDLTLAGHTHGFQFGVEWKNFKWSPSQYVYKQWAGLYSENDQHIYVNRGFGFLGYPGRVGILPEITVIDLV